MKDNFDNKLKDIFNQHEEQVDNELLWAGISEGIKEKKKRPIWLLFLLIPILIGATFYSYNLWSNSNLVSEYSSMDMVEVESVIETKKQDLLVNSEDQKYLLGERNIEQVAEINSSIVKSGNSTKSDKFKTKVSTLNIDSNRKNSITENANTLNTNTLNTNISSTTSESVIDENEAVLYSPINFNVNTDKAISSNNEIVNHQLTNINGPMDSNDVKFTDLDESLVSQSIESSIELKELFIDHETLDLDKTSKRTKQFTTKNWHVYTGIAIGQKSISEPDFESAYSSKEKYEFGLDYHVYHYKSVSISIGANFTQLVDAFEWAGSYKKIKEIEIEKEKIFYQNGSVISNTGLEDVDVDINRQLKKYPSRSIISIPIAVNYCLPLNNIQLTAYAQYYLSYQLSSTFYLVDNDGIPYSSSGNAQFLNSPLKFGLSTEKRINSKIDINFSLYLQQLYFNSNTGSNDIKHRNQYIGVSSGLIF